MFIGTKESLIVYLLLKNLHKYQ